MFFCLINGLMVLKKKFSLESEQTKMWSWAEGLGLIIWWSGLKLQRYYWNKPWVESVSQAWSTYSVCSMQTFYFEWDRWQPWQGFKVLSGMWYDNCLIIRRFTTVQANWLTDMPLNYQTCRMAPSSGSDHLTYSCWSSVEAHNLQGESSGTQTQNQKLWNKYQTAGVGCTAIWILSVWSLFCSLLYFICHQTLVGDAAVVCPSPPLFLYQRAWFIIHIKPHSMFLLRDSVKINMCYGVS